MPEHVLGQQTTYLEVDSYRTRQKSRQTPKSHTPDRRRRAATKSPSNPTRAVTPATTQSDAPDGATIEVEGSRRTPATTEIDSSTLEGRPRHAARRDDAQPVGGARPAGLHRRPVRHGHDRPGRTARRARQVGHRHDRNADLPAKSLARQRLSSAQPLSSDPQSGHEYRIFIDAETPRYGVSVRLKGMVNANPVTGQPRRPRCSKTRRSRSATSSSHSTPARTRRSQTRSCAAPRRRTRIFTPYSGEPAAEPFTAFPVDFDGKGGACPSPLPFSLTQSATASPTTGGPSTTFTFNLARADGQQYLSKLATTLPAGLVGRIPAVTLCGEPQARAGQVHRREPDRHGHRVGRRRRRAPTRSPVPPTSPAPTREPPSGSRWRCPPKKLGRSTYGTIVTRATVSPSTPTRRAIVVSSALPTIVGGVPLRLRTLAVNVNRPNFMLTPTNCGALATDTTLTSTFGTTQSLSTPFQATGCAALAFKPKLTARSNAKTSRPKGVSLTVKVAYPRGPQANITSVLVALPKHLPSRLSTLSKACLAAVFDANPFACPSTSRVGVVTVRTPVLPDKLTGPAIFVSHGGASFPDLDLVLSGDNVTVILVGNTNISKGITTSNFAADPRRAGVELRSEAAHRPQLGARGVRERVQAELLMPTTITAQNGKVIHQNTKIAVSGCHAKHKHKRHKRRAQRIGAADRASHPNRRGSPLN